MEVAGILGMLDAATYSSLLVYYCLLCVVYPASNGWNGIMELQICRASSFSADVTLY